jgi:hypothetical protein
LDLWAGVEEAVALDLLALVVGECDGFHGVMPRVAWRCKSTPIPSKVKLHFDPREA